MLTPPAGKLAIQPMRDPDKTESGILYVPDVAKGRIDQGIIKYMGPDCKLGFSIGDHVLFGGWVGSVVSVSGEGSLIFMSEEHVEAIVEDVGDVKVPGLYMYVDGEMIAATYETALSLCGQAYNESPYYRRVIKSKFAAAHEEKRQKNAKAK